MRHVRLLSRILSALLLTISAASAQTASLRGPFGFLLNVLFDDPSNANGTAVLGVMNLDGAGNVTGSAVIKNGATNSQAAQTLTGTLTGTYSINPDGTGNITFTADTGITVTLAMIVTDGGQGFQLVTTQCNCDLSQTVLSGFARAAHPGPLKGSYGFQINNSPKPAGTQIGIATFDGAGNITVSITAVNSGGGSSQATITPFNLTGTYSLKPDGSGVLNFPMPDQSINSTAIVVVDGGSSILTLNTDGTSRVQLGTARLQ